MCLGMVYYNVLMFFFLYKVIVLEKDVLKGFIFLIYLCLKGYEVIYIRISLVEDGMLLVVEEI